MWARSSLYAFWWPEGLGEVEAHGSDEGVDVLDGHGLHVAELRSRGVDRGDVVKSRMESFLKLRHVLRPRARSLCAFLLYR